MRPVELVYQAQTDKDFGCVKGGLCIGQVCEGKMVSILLCPRLCQKTELSREGGATGSLEGVANLPCGADATCQVHGEVREWLLPQSHSHSH